MSETIEMRTTQEQSGNYQVYAAATVNGEQPVKGLAVIEQAADQIGDWISATISDEAETTVTPEKFTGSTGRYSTEGPAIRHVYFSEEFLSQFEGFDADALEKGETTGLPDSLGVTLAPSSEEAYEEAKADRQESAAESAEEEVSGLLAGDAEADDSDESEAADSDEDESDEEEAADDLVDVSDEEIGLADD